MKARFLLPIPIKDCLERLNNAGYEAYVVGGAVRDMLLCREVYDYDITTNALPEQIISCFAECVIGINGIKYGTVAVHLGGYEIEITTYRIDGEYSDCRRPNAVEFTSCLAYDLARRDFTINAMAMDKHCNIVDTVGGKNDIMDKKISVIGEGITRFSEDSLRILRAFRFSAQLNFSIDDKTTEAIVKTAQLLENISKERITIEFKKILKCETTLQTLIQIKKLGVSEYFLPNMVLPKSLPNCENYIVRLAAIIIDITDVSRLCLSKKEYNLLKVLLSFKGVTIDNKIAIKHLLREMPIDYVKSIIELSDNTSQLMPILNEIIFNNECYSLSTLKINGTDLSNMGYRGRHIRIKLEELLVQVIDGECENDRDELLKRLKKQNGEY